MIPIKMYTSEEFSKKNHNYLISTNSSCLQSSFHEILDH